MDQQTILNILASKIVQKETAEALIESAEEITMKILGETLGPEKIKSLPPEEWDILTTATHLRGQLLPFLSAACTAEEVLVNKSSFAELLQILDELERAMKYVSANYDRLSLNFKPTAAWTKEQLKGALGIVKELKKIEFKDEYAILTADIIRKLSRMNNSSICSVIGEDPYKLFAAECKNAMKILSRFQHQLSGTDTKIVH